MAIKYPEALLKTIALFKKLPGVGSKTAERFAFYLLRWPQEELIAFSNALQALSDKIKYCQECGCLEGEEGCIFCHHAQRDPQCLCLIASHRDAFTIEQTHSFRGLYHVIGKLLSPLHGVYGEHLCLDRLQQRIASLGVQEIIIAFDSTIEGDVTALYIKEALAPLALKISRPAFGMPIGSTLDYIDGGTLARALTGRQFF